MDRTDPAFWPAMALTILLGAIGLASHISARHDLPARAALDGRFQSSYEDAFDAANPLRAAAIDALGAVRWALFGEGTADVVVGRDGWLFTAEDFVAGPGFEETRRASVDRIAQVEATLRARGIALLVLALPDKADIYADKLPRRRPAQVAQRHASVLTDLSRWGVWTLDASAALRATRRLFPSFQPDDTHWSPAGARAVATAVGEEVRRAGPSLSPAQVTTTLTGRVPHDGDLLAFVPTGAARAWIGPAQHTRPTFTTQVETGGGLFDAPPVDVALVGTSYSARAEWHFADFLRGALQADLIDHAAVGGGPFAPMEAFLAGLDAGGPLPKLVIWEIPLRYTTQENMP